MSQPFETDKWVIFPLKPMNEDLSESCIELRFRLKDDTREIRGITKEDLFELKKDLEDLGKWRKFRELKKDLEGVE